MHLMRYCLTEPGAGFDAAALKTRATPEGNSIFRMTGAKALSLEWPTSDLYAVMARTGGDGAGGVSCLLVERGLKGFPSGRRKICWHSQHTSR